MAAPAKRTLAFAFGILSLIGVLFAVSRSNRPPSMPADSSHRDVATNAITSASDGRGQFCSLAESKKLIGTKRGACG
jgi:hypothetical protein